MNVLTMKADRVGYEVGTLIVRWRGHAVEFLTRFEGKRVFQVVPDAMGTRFTSEGAAWECAQGYGMRWEDVETTCVGPQQSSEFRVPSSEFKTPNSKPETRNPKLICDKVDDKVGEEVGGAR